MTRDEFATAAIAILRSAVGWQTAIGRRLGVANRTVRRWLHDDSVPDWVAEKLAEMIGAGAPSPWPRDEWLIGDGVTADGRAREYIAHVMPPRFVARIVICGDAGLPYPDEEPADVTTGTVYVADASDPDEQTLLCEIEWVDAVTADEAARLLDSAADAIDTMSTRAASGSPPAKAE